MLLPKPGRIRNKKLLDEITNKGFCCISGESRPDPAHIKTKGSGGDDIPENLVPLARRFHTEQHTIGWRRFREKYGDKIMTWAEITARAGRKNG